MEDFDDVDEIIFGNEFSAKERCQQLGIEIDKAQKGFGADRFKYLVLLVFIYMRQTVSFDDFGDSNLYSFFEKIIPILESNGNLKFRNPLCCVIASYICINDDFKYSISKTKFNFVRDTVIPSNVEYFKKNGVTILDVIRYMRLLKRLLQ